MTLKIKSALLWHFNRCFCGISVGVFAVSQSVYLRRQFLHMIGFVEYGRGGRYGLLFCYQNLK